MQVKDAAKKLNVSPTWIRLLERKGLIPKITRDRNGHRRLTDEDFNAIKRALYPDKKWPTDEAQDQAPWPT